jgi:hypothetical protein
LAFLAQLDACFDHHSTAVRFIHFSRYRHSKDLGETDVDTFLSHVAAELDVAATTQNQALNTLTFLYKHVI